MPRQRVGTQLAERAEAELVWQHPEGGITDYMRQERQQMLLKVALGKIVSAAQVSDRIWPLATSARSDAATRLSTAGDRR